MNQFNPEMPPINRGGKLPPRYSTSIPFVIVLFTLIFATTKDIYFLHKRKIALIIQDSKAAEPLLNAGKEAAFVEKLRTDLNQLAPNDPVAAKILTDFYAAPPGPKQDAPGTPPPPPPQ